MPGSGSRCGGWGATRRRNPAGRGKDVAKLDDKEKDRLRKQALDGLTADLAAWAKRAEKDDARVREQVRRVMAHWQNDPDFAAVRDREALAKLPPAERDAWQR